MSFHSDQIANIYACWIVVNVVLSVF